MSVVLHIFSFVLARHRGEDGSLSQAQLRQTDRSEGISLETVSNFLVTTLAEDPSGDFRYNSSHFNSRELRFLPHKRIPPRNAFSF